MRKILSSAAIIIGLDSLPGIQTARNLASFNIPIVAIARYPNHYCCKTNVCKTIYFANLFLGVSSPQLAALHLIQSSCEPVYS